MSTPRVEVTARDMVNGKSSTEPLFPDGYIVVTGELMEITDERKWATGTVQITLKRKDRDRG